MPVKKEKTHFTVKLTELKAAEKVKLIKEVKNCIPGLNLVQVSLIIVLCPIHTVCFGEKHIVQLYVWPASLTTVLTKF